MNQITKLTQEQILRQLHKNYNIVNTHVKELNNGGCCIFAVELYEKLLLLELKPKMVIMTNTLAWHASQS